MVCRTASAGPLAVAQPRTQPILVAVEADAGECAFDDLAVRGDCGVTVVRGAERDLLAARAADGTPVLGECGGLMALSDSLTTTDGDTHDIAGVLPADVRMCDRYRALDHVELRADRDALSADAGQTRRGHEFHYSSADVDADARFAFEVVRGDGIHDGRDGLVEHRTLGAYCHLHPESGALDTFLDRVAAAAE